MAATRGPQPQTPAPQSQATTSLANQGTFKYGPALTLLRLGFSRHEDEPARERNYVPRLEKIAPEIGFQFVYSPAGPPWRWRTKEGRHDGHFQFLSVGGAFLIRLSDQDVSRGGVSLAAVAGFFDNAVSLGIGFDIYRGIPVADVNGARGAATAYTGVASWAFSREGEVTPENVFLLFSVNLAKFGGGE
jgi:hypothetical protein